MNVSLTQQLDTVTFFLLVVFVLFWIYSLLWVAKDISWRTNNLQFQIICIITVALLTPLFGLPLYFLMRPVQRYDLYKEQENQQKTETIHCKKCNQHEAIHHTYCTNCGDKIQHSCRSCGGLYLTHYKFCPDCGSKNA